MISFIRRYKHGLLILSYCLVYVFIFRLLEQRDVRVYHVIHTAFDDMIPFCEFFIIPYLLWFFYIVLVPAFFVFFCPKKEYYQLAFNLMMGMTVFLIVSYIYPNIQHLRPTEFPRDNIFTHMVSIVYSRDTPTNILPSIHVFNSLAIHMAVTHSERTGKCRWFCNFSLVLTTLIVLSTMFLKQHSVIDVCLGATMALFGFLLFYPQRAGEYGNRPAVQTESAGNRKY